MDLLKDKWVPVKNSDKITYKELLCSDKYKEISLYRDDMELATIQFLICLTQVIFTPKDSEELKKLINKPLERDFFDGKVNIYKNMFNLEHEKEPFMQTRGVNAKKSTDIQKLFTGLPVEKSATWFNSKEISKICPSCAAISLFNCASNSPNFGGGFKGNIRGGGILTFIYDKNLRKMIWYNILLKEDVDNILENEVNNKFTWIDRLKKDKTYYSSNIGLFRGLFWQPALVELHWDQEEGQCSSCLKHSDKLCKSFSKEKFKYNIENNNKSKEIKGLWLNHPHSPIQKITYKNKKSDIKYINLNNIFPAWTNLINFVLENNYKDKDENKIEKIPAKNINQFKRIFPEKNINLIVGGYQTYQSDVISRSSNLYNIHFDENSKECLEEIIKISLRIKNRLIRTINNFCKNTKINYKSKTLKKLNGYSDLRNKATYLFFKETENIIYSFIRKTNWKERKNAREKVLDKVIPIAKNIFEQILSNYTKCNIKTEKEYFLNKNLLNNELKKMYFYN